MLHIWIGCGARALNLEIEMFNDSTYIGSAFKETISSTYIGNAMLRRLIFRNYKKKIIDVHSNRKTMRMEEICMHEIETFRN